MEMSSKSQTSTLGKLCRSLLLLAPPCLGAHISCIGTQVFAETLRVTPDEVLADVVAIAEDGDTVLLAAGTHVLAVPISIEPDRILTFQSEAGAAATSITTTARGDAASLFVIGDPTAPQAIWGRGSITFEGLTLSGGRGTLWQETLSERNGGPDGGAILAFGAHVTLRECIVRDHQARREILEPRPNGPRETGRGAIAMLRGEGGSAGDLTLEDSELTGNRGGLYGAVFSEGDVTLRRCEVSSNYGCRVGAIQARAIVLEQCLFLGNANCPGVSGISDISSCEIEAVHVSFIGPDAVEGFGRRQVGVFDGSMTNCLMTGHWIATCGHRNASFVHCLFPADTELSEGGTISADARLEDLGEFDLGRFDERGSPRFIVRRGVYRPSAASPAIDAGVSSPELEMSTDFSGRRRVCGASVDIGAFELCAEPLERGDVNGDGRVDITDSISVLAFLFIGGAEPPCLDAADTDDNGVLDLTDGHLINLWLFAGGSQPSGVFECLADASPDDLDCQESNCGI